MIIVLMTDDPSGANLGCMTSAHWSSLLQALGSLLELSALGWAAINAVIRLHAIERAPKKAKWAGLERDAGDQAEEIALRELLGGFRGPSLLVAFGLLASGVGAGWGIWL